MVALGHRAQQLFVWARQQWLGDGGIGGSEGDVVAAVEEFGGASMLMVITVVTVMAW